MSAIVAMDKREDKISKVLRERNEELRSIIERAKEQMEEAQTELKENEKLLAFRELEFAGKPPQVAIFHILGEHNGKTNRDTLEQEALQRGACYGVQSPTRAIRTSITTLITAGWLEEDSKGNIRRTDKTDKK